MTTKQLYYLVTISDLGNLSAAAQLLEISQPALSKFLIDYENSLGFPIFFRYHRRLTPTSLGRYVIESAQKILDEQTNLLQTLRTATHSTHTRIRLATAPNRGAIIYSHIIHPFSYRYPDISLTLTELYANDQPNAIVHGQVDLAIGSGKTSDKITELPIAYEELLVSLPVSHPMSQSKQICLSDLRNTPFILQGKRHSIRILAEELFKEAGFSPIIAFESNDVLLVDSMLHQAIGAGLVSRAHIFPCEELVYRPLNPPVRQTLYIRYPFEHTLTEPEQYLIGLLIRERLADPRYQAISSPEIDAFIQFAEQQTSDFSDFSDSTTLPDKSTLCYTVPEVNLNTQLLQYIIAIADEKSLTQAAEKYYLSQPSLSRYLHKIESMLCTKLFTRKHNRLKPNNAGKIFINHARSILQIEKEMNEYFQAYCKEYSRGIYLQCDPALTALIQIQIKPLFSELYPDIPFHIMEDNPKTIQEALLNSSTDYGLYFSYQKNHPILNSKILAKTELVYCFGSDLSSLPDTISLHLPSSRKIMLATDGSALRTEQNRLLNDLFDSSPSIVCEAQLEILQILVKAGAADTILPIDFLPAEALSRCKPFQQRQSFYLLLVQHPNHNLPSPAKDLIRLLGDTFELYFKKYME